MVFINTLTKKVAMRGILVVIISCSLFISTIAVNAQSSGVNARDVSRTYANVSYIEIFQHLPALDSIVLEFDRRKPVFMKWYLSKSSTGEKKQVFIESFDLAFDGDKYILENCYAISCLHSLPRDEIDYMDSLQQAITYFKLNAIINRDSVTYQFLPPPFHHASYNGYISQLGGFLAKRCREADFGLTRDSLLIFQGIVIGAADWTMLLW